VEESTAIENADAKESMPAEQPESEMAVAEISQAVETGPVEKPGVIEAADFVSPVFIENPDAGGTKGGEASHDEADSEAEALMPESESDADQESGSSQDDGEQAGMQGSVMQ
jgi:hypothetical protein